MKAHTSKKNNFTFLLPLYLGLAYIVGILYFALLTPYMTFTDIFEKLSFIQANQEWLFVIYFFIYVVFGVVLALFSLSLFKKFSDTLLNRFALAMGLFWSLAVIFSGMIYTVGIPYIAELFAQDPSNALIVWQTVELISDSLGGGTEILGGIWMLCISVLALREKLFSKFFNYLGLVVGVSGVLSTIPNAEIFQMIFGLTQIVWFIWMSKILCGLVKKN
jgi:hypothetical protein